MNIYADRGNIAVLRARCEWRGLGFEHAAASLGEPLDPDAHDLFYMGGGQDRDQVAVAHDMAETKRDALHAAADRGAVVLAVCGGYQLLGHSYELGGEELPGVGPRGPAHRPRAGPAPDRQLRDRGRPRHRPAGDRRLREPRRAHLPRARTSTPLGRVLSGPRQQRPRRLRGRAPRQRDRHLPARPAAAEERLARRPPDRAGARRRAGAASRATSSRTPRTHPRGAPRASSRRRCRPRAAPRVSR